MTNLVKLTFGEHKHKNDPGEYIISRKQNIEKLACFRKYIKATWNKYDQLKDKPTNIYVVCVDRWLDTRVRNPYYTYMHVCGKMFNGNPVRWFNKDSVIVDHLPYFTKLILLSRLNYNQINKLKLNIFSRGIIWLLYHSERAFNPKLYK